MNILKIKMLKKQLITSTILIIIFSSIISASGVSSPYWLPDKPLVLAKGETKLVELNIQNMVGEGDLTYQAELVQGSEIAKLKENYFEVKEQTHDTIAPLEIKIPKDALPGATTRVKVQFRTVNPGQAGGVSLGTGMSVSFDVIVSEEIYQSPPTSNTTKLAIIISILIAIMIITLTIIRKKRQTSEYQNLNN